MILPSVLISGLAFYLFAFVTVASGVMVISARNPVHSVLFLILAFFNSAALFILLGAEFLAMIMVVVYVGAVAVLFLFVVMMLDINFVEMRQGFLQYLPLGALIGLILLIELAIGTCGEIDGTHSTTPDFSFDPIGTDETSGHTRLFRKQHSLGRTGDDLRNPVVRIRFEQG